MARLAAAFASSHSVMLTATLADWQHGFHEVDPKNPFYFDKQGNKSNYAALAAIAPEGSAAMVTPEKMAERFHAVHRAMADLRARIAATELDALIIVGDDQHELFTIANMPAVAMYYGETIRNAKAEIAPKEHWFKVAQLQRLEPEADRHYPVHAELSQWLIRGLCDDGFDITAIKELTKDQFEGHAFSFIHRVYLGDRPLPVIPVFLNTFDPPNQPTPKRCIELGAALRRLIAAYPQDIRVGVFASGGLSHFVVDEELDRSIIEGVRNKDFSFLASIDPKMLQAGSSEIRNWMVVAEAAADLEMDWVEYVPGYRTPALTGTGLAFASWVPRG